MSGNVGKGAGMVVQSQHGESGNRVIADQGLMLELLPTEKLRASLGSVGINERSRIVVAYSDDGIRPWATRLILTLDYAGYGERTSLLDGGMRAWTKDGRPMTAVVPERKKGILAPVRARPIIASADFVKARLGKPGVSIVDARGPAYYDGVSRGRGHDGAQRPGHIASAKSVPFTAPYGNDGFMRPTSELRALFISAGIAPGDTVIGYCHVGQQATAMLVAARVLGHPVLLYDGSFEDWSQRPAAEFPVETTPSRGKP